MKCEPLCFLKSQIIDHSIEVFFVHDHENKGTEKIFAED